MRDLTISYAANIATKTRKEITTVILTMKKKNNLKRFASYNIQGLNDITKQKLLADEFIEKRMQFMLMQETKIICAHK